MSKQIRVLAIARLDDDEVQAVRQVDPGVVVQCSVDREETARLLPEADAILASWKLDIDISKASHLKWVHFLSAGVDHFFRCRYCQHQLAWDGERLNSKIPCSNPAGHEPLVNLPGTDITITTSSGIAAIPIAEYVLATMLAFTRRLGMLRQAQEEHRWIKQSDMKAGELYGKTLGIVGLGNIGERIALLARAFGLRVLATKRSSAAALTGAEAAPADEIIAASHLKDLLAASDYVVLSAPLTPETEGMINEAALRAMKQSALLVNISRGRVVEEAALTRALKEHWIAGAVLDVFAQEPLDPANPLWGLPNATITPHIAAVTEPYSKRAVDLFIDNLRRCLSDQPLVNVLDRSRGY